MSSTIQNSTLISKVTESLTLNNQTINSENSYTVSGVSAVDKRIMTVPFASEITLILFSTSGVAAGQFNSSNVKYIRITNKDNTNFVRIRVTKSGSETFDIKVLPQSSFILTNTSESVSYSGTAFGAFISATSINAQADTANVDVELMVASA